MIGGLQDGVPFLGTVGMIGTHYSDAHIATGACFPVPQALRLVGIHEQPKSVGS